MRFNPNITVGKRISNKELSEIFRCGNMGGMRRSHTTDTLVLVSDYTKGLYHDKWINRVLHYTGTGKIGDQDINYSQNKTLANSKTNGVDVHLFEVLTEGEYIYCGRVELVDSPYIEKQPDDNGKMRNVWMFPVKPVPDNDVQKPKMFVFEDMDDYKARGKDVDKKYNEMRKSSSSKKSTKIEPEKHYTDALKPMPRNTATKGKKPRVGMTVRHSMFGEGIIKSVDRRVVTVDFGVRRGLKSFNVEVCFKNGILEIVEK